VAAALLLGVVVSLAFMTKAELRRIEAEEARLHADEQTRLAEDRLIEVSQQKARAEQIVRMLHLLSAAQTSLHDPGYNGDFEEYYGLVRALKAGELADDPTADIALRRAFAAAAEKVKDQEYRNDALLLMEGAVQTASRVHGDAHEVTLGLMREAALAAVAAGNVASEIHWLTERIARLRDSHGGPHAEVVLAMLDLAHARVRLAMPPKEDPGRPWWSDGSPAVATQDADADTHPVPQVASQREAHAEAASTLFEEAKALARGLPDAHMTFDRAASAHAAWLSARGGEVAADRVQMERATFWVQDGPSAANPDAATHALSSVVTELVSRGRHELALEVAKMRIALCDARFHAADWRRGGARTSAARIRIAMGDLDEAEDLLLQAQPILRAWWQSSRSTRDADVENVYHMLIALYERLEAERPGGAYAEHVARWRTELESLHEEGRQRLSLRPAAERARTLNNEAWQVARFAHTAAAAGPGGLQRVVNDATRAVELAPAARELAMYLNTLGVAEFRSGLYQRAVQTLHRAEEAYAEAALPKDTVNLVFIAMAQRRLGLLADADRTRGEYLSRRSQLEALRIGDEYSAWHAEFLAEFGLSE
jgi:tetratricopeptide (TPR) repeat protein